MARAAASCRRVCPLRHLNLGTNRPKAPGMCEACYHGIPGLATGNRFLAPANLEALPGWRNGTSGAMTRVQGPGVPRGQVPDSVPGAAHLRRLRRLQADLRGRVRVNGELVFSEQS